MRWIQRGLSLDLMCIDVLCTLWSHNDMMMSLWNTKHCYSWNYLIVYEEGKKGTTLTLPFSLSLVFEHCLLTRYFPAQVLKRNILLEVIALDQHQVAQEPFAVLSFWFCTSWGRSDFHFIQTYMIYLSHENLLMQSCEGFFKIIWPIKD